MAGLSVRQLLKRYGDVTVFDSHVHETRDGQVRIQFTLTLHQGDQHGTPHLPEPSKPSGRSIEAIELSSDDTIDSVGLLRQEPSVPISDSQPTKAGTQPPRPTQAHPFGIRSHSAFTIPDTEDEAGCSDASNQLPPSERFKDKPDLKQRCWTEHTARRPSGHTDTLLITEDRKDEPVRMHDERVAPSTGRTDERPGNGVKRPLAARGSSDEEDGPPLKRGYGSERTARPTSRPKENRDDEAERAKLDLAIDDSIRPVAYDQRNTGIAYGYHGHIYGNDIDREIIWSVQNDTSGRLASIAGFERYSGKERHRRKPEMFTTKGRLLEKFRPARALKKLSYSPRPVSLQHSKSSSTKEAASVMTQDPKPPKPAAKYTRPAELSPHKHQPLGECEFIDEGEATDEEGSLYTDESLDEDDAPATTEKPRSEIALTLAQKKRWKTSKNLSDDDLLEMWQTLSNKERGRVAPTIFNDKGEFRPAYRRLAALAKNLPKANSGRNGGRIRRIINRPFLEEVKIDGHPIYCSAFELHSARATTAIVIGFTRCSGRTPRYGLAGMYRRAQVAVDAFADLLQQPGIIKLSIPRAHISSRAQFFNKKGDILAENEGSVLDELWNVLNAADQGRQVYFLSIGLDGFTTNTQNFIDITDQWPHLSIHFVIVVPSSYEGSQQTFRTKVNGMRYAQFNLTDIAQAVVKERVIILDSPTTVTKSEHPDMLPELKEYLDMVRLVNLGKVNLDYREYLDRYTIGRSEFRVNPATYTENGVEVGLKMDDMLKIIAKRRKGIRSSTP